MSEQYNNNWASEEIPKHFLHILEHALTIGLLYNWVLRVLQNGISQQEEGWDSVNMTRKPIEHPVLHSYFPPIF